MVSRGSDQIQLSASTSKHLKNQCRAYILFVYKFQQPVVLAAAKSVHEPATDTLPAGRAGEITLPRKAQSLLPVVVRDRAVH